MADKKFEPHMMYGDGEAKKAKTNQEHLKLKKMGWGHKKPAFKMNSPLKGKKGLWANIHAKRKKGGTPNKPGDKGYPTDKAIRDSQ